MEFLDAGDAVLDSRMVDLRTAAMNLGEWETYALSAPSPAGFAKIRVTASANDMVDNFGGQDLYFDNFGLRRTTINLLQNPALNTPGAPAGWTLTELPEGTDNASVINFAHHATTQAPIGQGLWVRAFAGGDFGMEQTLPASAGANYTFSAWTVWEAGYIGDSTVFPETETETFLEMAFLNASNAVIGAPLTLDLDAAGMDNDLDGGNIEPEDWRQFMLNGVAPAGTTSVRVAVRATGLGNSDANPQSAFFDEFSLQGPAAGVPGDWDNDSDVDGNDFLIIQRGLGTQTTAADLATWKANFGRTSAAPSIQAVPEPASATVALVLSLCGWNLARTRRSET
jgi:hypothetical protein